MVSPREQHGAEIKCFLTGPEAARASHAGTRRGTARGHYGGALTLLLFSFQTAVPPTNFAIYCDFYSAGCLTAGAVGVMR